jgi:NADH:ubiquinone oxidoreductase subunit K
MFLSNSKNLITIILYSEIIWVVLYNYAATVGTLNDDLIITSSTFFLLALAGLEFCIGFIIIIFFRNFKKSFNLDKSCIVELNQLKSVSVNNYNFF